MANLKTLRLRIRSVRSTQKITRAMKMVAASKLRRAQERAEAARPYALRMERMLRSLAGSVASVDGAPKLIAGTGQDRTHLLLIITSDRGLCGGFNTSIVRAARARIAEMKGAGKIVKLFCVGRKGRDQLRRDHGSAIIGTIDGIDRGLGFHKAEDIGQRLVDMFEGGEFDVCTVVFNRFKSVIAQVVTFQQLMPFQAPPKDAAEASGAPKAIYEFEPDETEILADLLPRNLAVQIYGSILESQASEQGARMTAMDNATRNAGDMIGRLTMVYNRTRQAVITREIIEIVSGAEAL
ncbi:MAG: F0F1 ATP synthase subunit gamma [Alphaproteobacteria bacterium]|nr:F0F1 ATP synthase subunit gamma [Alphaproteobacteria bacterium]